MNNENIDYFLKKEDDSINSDSEDSISSDSNLINWRYSLDREDNFVYESTNNFNLSEKQEKYLDKYYCESKEEYLCYYNNYLKHEKNFMNEYKNISYTVTSYSRLIGTVGYYWNECDHKDFDDEQDFSEYEVNKEFNSNRILKFLKTTPLFRGLKENIEVYCRTKYKLLCYNETLPDDCFTYLEDTYPEYFLNHKSDRSPYLSCIVNISFISIKDEYMNLVLKIDSIQFQRSRNSKYEKVGGILEANFDDKNYFINIRPKFIYFNDGGNYNCGTGGSGLLLLMQLNKYNEYKKNFIQKNRLKNKYDYY